MARIQNAPSVNFRPNISQTHHRDPPHRPKDARRKIHELWLDKKKHNAYRRRARIMDLCGRFQDVPSEGSARLYKKRPIRIPREVLCTKVPCTIEQCYSVGPKSFSSNFKGLTFYREIKKIYKSSKQKKQFNKRQLVISLTVDMWILLFNTEGLSFEPS